MKQLKYLVGFYVLVLMGLYSQNISNLVIGFTPTTPSGAVATQGLNSATTFVAYGFNVSVAETLDTVRVYISAVTNTPGTNFTADIYSNSATGLPNASVAGPITVSASLAGGAGWYEFTGFSYALTPGIQYYAVFKNTDGSPTANFPSLRFGGGQTNQVASGAGKYGMGKLHTTDGTTWGTIQSNNVGMRLAFASGRYWGMPISNIATTGTTTGVYASREGGNMFTLPTSGLTYSIAGAACATNVTSTPTGELRYRLYTGSGASPSLVGTTYTIPLNNISSSGNYNPAMFVGGPISVSGGTTVRVVMSETTQSDANTLRYDSYLYTIDNTAASKALTPFGGTQFTYSTDGGATFTDTDTNMVPCGLLMANTPFTATGGGITGIVRIQ